MAASKDEILSPPFTSILSLPSSSFSTVSFSETAFDDSKVDDDDSPNPDFGAFPMFSDFGTCQPGTESSGYETGSDENLVKGIEPCEGPYKGGNDAFIFLNDSLFNRFPEVENTSMCKVEFSSPKQRLMPLCEVHATVKNVFTLKVSVPCCPRITEEQRVREMLTVQVIVKTQNDVYIGDSIYTYKSNPLSQLEECLRALDD